MERATAFEIQCLDEARDMQRLARLQDENKALRDLLKGGLQAVTDGILQTHAEYQGHDRSALRYELAVAEWKKSAWDVLRPQK
jgi:hypothetical protein